MSVKEHLTREQIAAFAAHGNRLEVDEHLSECPQCRELLSQYISADRGFRRQSAFSVDDESSHLDYARLEAYVDGKMTAAEKAAADEHTKVCPGCARGLRDLVSFREQLKSEEQLASEHEPGKVAKPRLARPRPTWPTLARIAAAVLVAAGLAALLLWRSGDRAVPPQLGDQVSHDIAPLHPEEQHAVREAIAQAKLTLPPELEELRPGQEILRKPPVPGDHFLLLSPVGEATDDPQPVFQWQPLAGAQKYMVHIVGPDPDSVQSSPWLREMQWKASEPLARGRVYQWEVTAILKNRVRVISPRPPMPAAKFRVLEAQKAEEIEDFQRSHPGSHLVLGILYARLGMLTAAENELRQISQNDPNYDCGAKLLKSIEEAQKTPGLR